MPDFISYLRVSTDRQGALGLGIEAQRQAVERYVASVGGRLISERVEVETGSSAKRPILLNAIAQCRRERAVLLIARLDPLSHSAIPLLLIAFGGRSRNARRAIVPLLLEQFAGHEQRQPRLDHELYLGDCRRCAS